MIRISLILLLGMIPHLAFASACRDVTFESSSYTVCDVTLNEDLRLFHAPTDGSPYGSFSAVNDALADQGQSLDFAMNAGMFHPDRAPVGLLVIEGREIAPIITSDGPGNFGLLPNGVFCVSDARFAVIESRQYKQDHPDCRYATQSGPMLVIDGALHPRFLPESDSYNIRNGVGVSADGQVASFVISNRPVNFHTFARLFRDALGLPDALYFDGSISRLFAPEIGRRDAGFAMGPIIGTVRPAGQ
jgi:uncharacterized protein YigE (DUF2233 family)